MDGSSVLAQTMLDNDLVDELYLSIYPVVVGGDKQIFPAEKWINFSLVESSPFPTGVGYCHYRWGANEQW